MVKFRCTKLCISFRRGILPLSKSIQHTDEYDYKHINLPVDNEQYNSCHKTD